MKKICRNCHYFAEQGVDGRVWSVDAETRERFRTKNLKLEDWIVFKSKCFKGVWNSEDLPKGPNFLPTVNDTKRNKCFFAEYRPDIEIEALAQEKAPHWRFNKRTVIMSLILTLLSFLVMNLKH